MKGGTKKWNRAAQEVPAGRLRLPVGRLVVMFGRERGSRRLVALIPADTIHQLPLIKMDLLLIQETDNEQFDNDPFQNILTSEPSSQESSSNFHPANQPFEHLNKWTKNHSLNNVIGNPSRLVSTRCQLQTDAMWCYFDAFLTSVKPKNYKEALKESCWIEAMQEEIHEFERLQV
ncbi:hypothetical protein Tco_1289566 [Tanacetum coccineum]